MGGSILIVEDELVTQRLIAASLERAGYKVTRAPSAAQAEVAIREVIPEPVPRAQRKRRRPSAK